MKILTFDVEDWFHILDHPGTQSQDSWHAFPSRLKAGVESILELLAETDQKATFFCLGWVAERYPEVIRAIDDAGFHIGTHSYAHQLVYQQSQEDFRSDLQRSLDVLQNITGKTIDCYRAPGFSITSECLWAFEILMKEGIKIDCSLFPANRSHGGLPNCEATTPSIGKWNDEEIKLFPMSTKAWLGRNIIFSGGGYFRLVPGRMIMKWFSEEDYVMTYFHPRDFDVDQPVIAGLGPYRRFKSYVGIGSARAKLFKVLTMNKFVDILEAESSTDWNGAPRVDLCTDKGVLS